MSPYSVEMMYEEISPGGASLSSEIFFDEQTVATITFKSNHLGSLLAIVYDGEVRCGVITEEDIVL